MKRFYKSVFMIGAFTFCLFFLVSSSQAGGAIQYPTYDISQGTYSPSPYGYYSGYGLYGPSFGGYFDYRPSWGGYSSYSGYSTWSSGGYPTYYGYPTYNPGYHGNPYNPSDPLYGTVSRSSLSIPSGIMNMLASSNWNTAQKGYELSLPYFQSAVISGWTPYSQYSQWHPSSPSYASSTGGYKTLTGRVVGSNSIEVKESVIKCWTNAPQAAVSNQPLNLSGYMGSVVEVSGFQTANDLYSAELERVVY